MYLFFCDFHRSRLNAPFQQRLEFLKREHIAPQGVVFFVRTRSFDTPVS